MKKSRFTESQIVAILKEADAGMPVGDVIRKHGISSASYYKWKAKYGGLDASELKRIKELEGQLAEFKQIVADLTLENKAIDAADHKQILPPARKREAVDYLAGRGEAPNYPSLSLCGPVSGGLLPQAHRSGQAGRAGSRCAQPDRGQAWSLGLWAVL
jgi:putative transposase